MNRPCALQDSPNPPHLCACLLWLPAVRGHSDRSRGLMGLAFRVAAFQHIKPRLSFQQNARFTNDQHWMRFYAWAFGFLRTAHH